jgi:hypothetical protein
MKTFQRASQIKDEDVSLFYDTDEDEIVFQVKGTEDKPYMVSCVEGIFRCDCDDYIYSKHKELGSYCCKHILKCINFYFNNML